MKKKLLTFSLLSLLAIGLGTTTASADETNPLDQLLPGETKVTYQEGDVIFSIHKAIAPRVIENKSSMTVTSMTSNPSFSWILYYF